MCAPWRISTTSDKWGSPLVKSLSVTFLAICTVFWGDALKIQVPGYCPRLLSASVLSSQQFFLVGKTQLWVLGGGLNQNLLLPLTAILVYSCGHAVGAGCLAVGTNEMCSPSWHILFLLFYSLTFLGNLLCVQEPGANSCLGVPTALQTFSVLGLLLGELAERESSTC